MQRPHTGSTRLRANPCELAVIRCQSLLRPGSCAAYPYLSGMAIPLSLRLIWVPIVPQRDKPRVSQVIIGSIPCSVTLAKGELCLKVDWPGAASHETMMGLGLVVIRPDYISDRWFMGLFLHSSLRVLARGGRATQGHPISGV